MSATQSKKLRHSTLGFSLIELLIAMTLGTFLLGGLLTFGQDSQKAIVVQKAMQQTQKNSRFAIDSITSDVQSSGYTGFYGGLSPNIENTLNNPTDEEWDVSGPVKGYNNVNNGKKVLGLDKFTKGSDILLLKGMDGEVATVITHNSPSKLSISKTDELIAGDIVFVSDANQASLFQISSISHSSTTTTLNLIISDGSSGGPGNAKLLDNTYDFGANVGKYNLQMFYLNTGRDKEVALYQANLSNDNGTISLKGVELASGIENIQIAYGINTSESDSVETFLAANKVTDWDDVTSVNIAMLAKSASDDVVSTETEYVYDDNTLSFVNETKPPSFWETVISFVKNFFGIGTTTTKTKEDKSLKIPLKSYVTLRNGAN